jgi:hypothetical protein
MNIRPHFLCFVGFFTLVTGRCELCKTKFRFDPQYAENTPDRLPPHEVILGLSSRIVARWLPLTARIIVAASLWLLVAPLMTAYLYHGWMHRPSSIPKRWQAGLISSDIISGAVLAAMIIISFLSLMSFADFLRVHWAGGGPQQQQRGGGRGANAARNQRGGENARDEEANEEQDAIDRGLVDESIITRQLAETYGGSSNDSESESDSDEILYDSDEDDCGSQEERSTSRKRQQPSSEGQQQDFDVRRAMREALARQGENDPLHPYPEVAGAMPPLVEGGDALEGGDDNDDSSSDSDGSDDDLPELEFRDDDDDDDNEDQDDDELVNNPAVGANPFQPMRNDVRMDQDFDPMDPILQDDQVVSF